MFFLKKKAVGRKGYDTVEWMEEDGDDVVVKKKEEDVDEAVCERCKKLKAVVVKGIGKFRSLGSFLKRGLFVKAPPNTSSY